MFNVKKQRVETKVQGKGVEQVRVRRAVGLLFRKLDCTSTSSVSGWYIYRTVVASDACSGASSPTCKHNT